MDEKNVTWGMAIFFPLVDYPASPADFIMSNRACQHSYNNWAVHSLSQTNLSCDWLLHGINL
jgi:hypothetical protein